MSKLKKITPFYHIDSHQALISDTFNNKLMPVIWVGKEKGYDYQFKLVKSKKFLFFWSTTKPYIEIIATDKNGTKKEDYSTKLLMENDQVAKDVHYWIEWLIRENKPNYRERFTK